MSRINGWLTNTFPLSAWRDDHDPGVDTARVIADKAVSITILRGGSTLGAQTVRIEEMGGGKQVQNTGGAAFIADAVVIGYKGHPTIANTDILPGDRFAHNGVRYQVVSLVPGLTDAVQAYAQLVA